MFGCRKWPSNHSNAGILDLVGDPKSDYYFQKNLWVTEPMLYMGTSKFVTIKPDNNTNRSFRRASTDQNYNYNAADSVSVSCYTTCEEVELLVNAKSLGRKKLSAEPTRIINLVFPFEAGNIIAKAYNKGNEVSKQELRTVGMPASFRASFDKEYLNSEGDLTHLKIEIIDKERNLVTTATNVITVKVTGAGEL